MLADEPVISLIDRMDDPCINILRMVARFSTGILFIIKSIYYASMNVNSFVALIEKGD